MGTEKLFEPVKHAMGCSLCLNRETPKKKHWREPIRKILGESQAKNLGDDQAKNLLETTNTIKTLETAK